MPHALALAFKGVALAMAAVTIAFVVISEGDAGTYAIFLAIGLFSMGVGSIMDHRVATTRPESGAGSDKPLVGAHR